MSLLVAWNGNVRQARVQTRVPLTCSTDEDEPDLISDKLTNETG
jgi:hypothetical protein